jgi:hypothetical protein
VEEQMKKKVIKANPEAKNSKRRFLKDVTVILGDDIENLYKAVAKDLPDSLPEEWVDPADKKNKKIIWISNFGLANAADDSLVDELPSGQKYTIELEQTDGQWVYFDGKKVKKLNTSAAGANKLKADLTLGDPPIGTSP